MKVKLIVTDILCTYGRHNLYSHSLCSNWNILTSFRSLSSTGAVFHTLDAKYCKVVKPKLLTLMELTWKRLFEISSFPCINYFLIYDQND